MIEELKPCPFCGGEITLTCSDGDGAFYIRCSKCGASTGHVSSRKGVVEAESEAVERWNRRAEPPAAPDDPARYSRGGIECIDAIRAALDPVEYRGFCKGSVLGYVWREKHKGGDRDLGKAVDFIGYALDASEEAGA
ncbi:MAG: Lar family restriction alleviation protein [Slackia piriformis]|uniref:Lar family restriction alleviation protein n=1 Tax=Slackia piriformis TaxID=626934 RepID=A0A943UY61_9ACTN|nr:Lar family restriction alleviation protein [Slackia piriformis]